MEATISPARALGEGRTWRWSLSLVLFLLPFFAFAPSLSNEFVNWDDNVTFWENACLGRMGSAQLGWAVDSLLGKAGPPPGGEAGALTSFQPLSWWLLDAQVALFGLNPFAVHLVSLLFHAANTVLLYWVVLALLRRARPDECARRPVLALCASLATALYALHPLRTEVVAWASAQPYLPCAFLVLLSVLTYVRAFTGVARPNRKMLGLCLVFFMLALLAKPLTVALPLIFLLIDYYPLRTLHDSAGNFQRRALGRAVLNKLPFLLVSGLATVMAVHLRTGLVPLEHDGLMGRLTQVGHSVAFYLEKTFAPTGLCYLYAAPSPTPWFGFTYFGATLGVALATVVFFLRARRNPGPAVCWLTFLLLLGPTIGIFRTNEYVVADRYSYFPMMAAVVPLAAALFHLGSARPGAMIGLMLTGALVVGACGALSWQQARTWHDSFALRSHGLRHGAAPSASAQGTMGSMLLEDNRVDESVPYLRRALEILPDYAQARKLLGIALLRQRSYGDALPHLRRCIDVQPDDAQCCYLLGFALAHLGRLEEAETFLAESMRLEPENAETQRLRGLVMAQRNRSH
jgi:hypothetical protein